MYDLSTLQPSDLTECGARLAFMGAGAPSMEYAANRIVRYLYEELGHKGQKACALVRFYKTHPYGELNPDLQAFARGILGRDPDSAAIRCLTLLATAGDRPEWNSRAQSNGHKAIPLPSEQVVAQLPMIAQLVAQLGLEITAVLKPAPEMIVDMGQKTYNVSMSPRPRAALTSPRRMTS